MPTSTRSSAACTPIRSPCSDPHEVATGLAIRVFRPHARGVELRDVGDADPKPFKRIHAGRPVRDRRAVGDARGVRLSRARVVARRIIERDRRSVSLRPGAHRASICTCSAKARTSRPSTSWARAASRTASATACTSRCGRRMRDASAWSATSTPGTAACTRCARCGRAATGKSSFPTSAAAIRTSSK